MSRALRRALSAGAALAIVAASVAVAAPAQAIPGLWSTTTSPAASSASPTSAVTFSWGARAGYTGDYRLSWLGTGGTGSVEVAATTTTVTLADGTYTWYVGYKQTGLWRETTPQLLTVDSTAPGVSLTSPAEGTVVGRGVPVVLTGLVTDPTFVDAVISLDGVPLATVDARILLRSIATGTLADGAHTITVTARDGFDRTTTATRGFVVDATAPAANFAAPVDGSYLAPGADLSVSATLSDTSAVTAWSLSVDGTPVASGSGTAVAATVPTASWADASIHTLAVTARDAWGNEGTSTASVLADARKPRLAITDPIAGAVVGTSVDIAGTASDNGSGLASVGVELRRINGSGGCGQVLLGAPAALGAGTWTVDDLSLAGIADGDYCIRALAADAVGNTSGERVLPITVDQTAPSLPGSLAPSGWVTTAQTVSWAASTDPHGVHYDWWLLPDGTDAGQSGSTDATSVTFDDALAPGGYVLQVVARDDLGNTTGIATTHFDVIGVPQFLAPTDGTAVARDLEAEWSGVNAPGGVRRYEVEAVHLDTERVETFTVNDGSTLLSRNFGSAFEEGEWTLRVRAVYENRVGDPLTRFGPWSSPVTIVHDLTGPEAPTLLTPSDGSAIAHDDFTFTWTAPSDAVSYVFRYNNTGDTNGSGRLRGADTMDTVTASLSADGIYDATFWWQVRAIDALGNRGPWSAIRTVEVDRVAPAAVTLRSLADGSTLVGSSATFQWFATEDGARYEFELARTAELDQAGSLVDAVAVSTDGLQTVASDMPAGLYHWHVRAVDAAGNAGAWSPVWSLQLRAPVLPVTTFSATGGGDAEPTPDDAEPALAEGDGTDAAGDGGSDGAGSGDGGSDAPVEESDAAADDTVAEPFPTGWIIGGLVVLVVIAAGGAGIRFLLARR